ncbi:heme ABC exporter ATP-binding protein CcmA [Ponticaulis profundi]|uniref:Heme ABC exporter ATP-binding protein CcmA n=1 Tax=Ponticaulis profundi TaxID=2665222 RepID=A0ABW1S9J5_9PROT
MNLSNRESPPDFGLKIISLTGARGYNLLFSGLTVDVAPGNFVALVGPNGSGKTTLLRMLAGLITPEAGEIERPPEVREQGPFYLGHESGLRPNETPLSHLKDWADLHHATSAGISAAIERVGLTERAMVPAHALSAGQKRRLCLARTLVAPRQLWLLDEPAAALDLHGQMLLCALIREHVAQGGICVAALHDPLDIEPDLTINLKDYQP